MTINAVQQKSFESAVTLLTNLVLAVHQDETDEDREAKRILDELLRETNSDAKYEVVKVAYESPEFPLPYLRFSRSSVYGLDRIRELAETERRFR